MTSQYCTRQPHSGQAPGVLVVRSDPDLEVSAVPSGCSLPSTYRGTVDRGKRPVIYAGQEFPQAEDREKLGPAFSLPFLHRLERQ